MSSSLIEKLMVKEKEEYITSARNSQSHDMYSKLKIINPGRQAL